MKVYMPIGILSTLIALGAMLFAYGTFHPLFLLGALLAGLIAVAAQHVFVLASKNNWFWIYWFLMVISFHPFVLPVYTYPTLLSAKVFWFIAFTLFSTLFSSLWFLGKKIEEKVNAQVWFWICLIIGMIPNFFLSLFIGTIFSIG